MKAVIAALLVPVAACSPAPQGRPTAAPFPGPTRIESGVPVGYAQNAEGARAAATRYVAVLGGQLGLDPSRRDLALAAVSPDGRTAPHLAERWATRPNVERATGATQALQSGGPMIAAAAPVMSKVAAYEGDTATVVVWVTAVLGTERLNSLDQAWATETVSLRWEGDWKLVAYDSAPGPVPALHQPATALADALARTSDMQGPFDVAP